MRNQLNLVTLSAVLAFCSIGALATEKDSSQTGTLVDLQLIHASTGYVRAGQSYCLAVSLEEFGYLLQYGPLWAYSYAPSELIVGDPIQVRIKGNTMYLQKPRGGELKTPIIRRERNTPDKKPVSCALPVSPG